MTIIRLLISRLFSQKNSALSKRLFEAGDSEPLNSRPFWPPIGKPYTSQTDHPDSNPVLSLSAWMSRCCRRFFSRIF
jgi:hypothetical protein